MKTSNASSRSWTWQRSYLAGILLFLVGAFSLVYGETKNLFGYAFVISALFVLFLNAWTVSIRRFKSKSFSVGSALLAVSLVLVCDMMDEAFHDYPGWSGNDFLLDSLEQLLYLLVVPVFVLVGVFLLMKDSKNSIKR